MNLKLIPPARYARRLLPYLTALLLAGSFLPIQAQRYGFEQFGVADGMMMSKVNGICEDTYGNLWIATSGSLTRFDGHEFRNFTHRDGMLGTGCNNLMQDRQGDIWTSTYEGISRLHGNRFINYEWTFDPTAPRYPMPLFEDAQGRVWAGRLHGGLAYVSGDSLVSVPFWQNEGITAIGEDAEGALLVAVYKNGLWRLRGDQWESLLLPSPETHILTLFRDQDRQVWLGTDQQLLRFDGTHFHAELTEGVSDIAADEAGTLWLTTHLGLIKYAHGQMQVILPGDATQNTLFKGVYVDRENNVWCSIKGAGLYRFKGETFEQLEVDGSKVAGYPMALVRDKAARLWIGNWSSGIDLLEDKRVRNFTQVNGRTLPPIRCGAVDSLGQVWMGTQNGPLRIRVQPGGAVSLAALDSRLKEDIFALSCTADGTLWLGTYEGLFLIPAAELTQAAPTILPAITADQQLTRVRAICPLDKDRLAIGAAEGLHLYEDGKVSRLLSPAQLEAGDISAISRGPGSLLCVGTFRNGLFLYDLNTQAVRHVTLLDGLTSEMIYALVWDSAGHLFAGSPNGLDKLHLDSAGKIQGIRHYGIEEGFEGMEVNQGAVLQERDGSIWLGTTSGAFRYRPDQDRRNAIAPATYLTAIQVPAKTGKGSYFSGSNPGSQPIPDSLRLPYDQNQLIFSFQGVSLRNPTGVRYQYRLAGLEDQWQGPTTRQEAAYSNLPPGDYTFLVKSANSDGVWNATPLAYSFHIIAPFWQTTWFRGLILLVIAATLYLLHRDRLQRHLKRQQFEQKIQTETQQRVRQRIARDFHDEMGNKLAGITAYANMIEYRTQGLSHELSPILQKIATDSRLLSEHSRDFIWAIDPQSDNLNEVFLYLKDFAENALNYTEIQFYAGVDIPEMQDIYLPPGHSRQIILIIKEAFTNALKHADCQAIYLDLTSDRATNSYQICLRDDGRGMRANPGGKGWGLENMQNRAREIGCELRLQSEPNQGTTLTLAGIRALRHLPVDPAGSGPTLHRA